ncbi:hypothetical protein KJ934_01220 [Patescibacteria group bacterium]|nr:hypothetical protein [Patescibacteria group bacterium]MBU4353668.1 hypothetical protein [Patescibacteria group bacterium]MBU4477058.1 hypothetical protein [Patescibacteria group bacterium]MCG2699188.1 hypothetical protein [Candidatus Parcubacteria bacterium]
MNEVSQTLLVMIISFAFATLFMVALYLGSRSLRNVIRVLRGELDPVSPRGEKAVTKLKKMMRDGGYTEEEINFVMMDILKSK